MITRQPPPIEGRIDEHFRVGRVFYLERDHGTDAEGFRRDGTYKARCRSPWGELCLWPYEYATLSTDALMDMWQSGELVFHPINIDQARLDGVVFYCRSRGIGLAEAAVMALGSLEEPIGWFEPDPEIAPTIEAMAKRRNTSLAEHIRNNPRAAA